MIFIQTDVNKVDLNAWSDYVKNHTNGNIFQTPEMFELYNSSQLTEPIVLFAYNDSHFLCGALLAVVQKESKGILGKFSRRSIIWGGPLTDNPETATLLLKAYSDIAKKKVIYSQFRNMFHCEHLHSSFTTSGFHFKEHLDILMDLSLGEKTLWSQVHKNRKKKINNGHNKGIIVTPVSIFGTNHLTSLYPILQKLYKKIQLPVPAYDYFSEAIRIFESKGYLKTFIATCHNEVVGFIMVFVYKGLVYGWYGASDETVLHLRPNDIIPWEILKWGANNHQHTFDFGGAGRPGVAYGVRDYKLKFGGKLVNFGRYEKIHKPILYFVGTNGIKLWRLRFIQKYLFKTATINENASTYKILTNHEIPLEEWNKLLHKSSYTSPYQTPAFFEFINSLPNYKANVFAISSPNGISSLILVTIQKEKGFIGLFSKRAIIYGGPILSNDSIKEGGTLLNYVKEYYHKKVIYLEVRNFFNYDWLTESLLISEWKYVPYLNFQLPLLNETKETISKKFQYNRRREIRLSLAEGATYHECQHIEEVKKLYTLLFDLYQKKVKLPLPDLNYFVEMYKRDICKVFIVVHNNKIIGGSFCPYLPQQAIYTNYYCGIKNYHKKIFPTHLAVMAAIDFAINNSIKYLDFMGAGKPEEDYGVRKYKKEFGGNLIEPGRFVHINKPILYKIGKIGLKLLSKIQ